MSNPNRISHGNSSTTPLAAGATFTGEWEDVVSFNSVVVAAKTDQDGTLTVQFSPDGTNVDSTLTRYYRTDQIEPPHRFTITRAYMRVTFANTSASPQTYLRLQTSLGDKTALNVPVDAVMSQDYDAIATRPTHYASEVALGRRQGSTLWNKFGYNEDIDIGTEVIAAFGGTFVPPTTASTLRFVSSSADDAAAGTGARTLTVYGIDANRLAQTETVTLNGTSNVDTVTTWLGVNRVAIATAGSGQANAGTITVTMVTGGATVATMPAGEGATQQAIFYTQANCVALADFLVLSAAKISGGGSPRVTFKGWMYSAVTGAKTEVFRHMLDTSVENTVVLEPPQPFVIPEQSCLWFEATTDTNNTSASCRFSLVEHRDVDA